MDPEHRVLLNQGWKHLRVRQKVQLRPDHHHFCANSSFDHMSKEWVDNCGNYIYSRAAQIFRGLMLQTSNLRLAQILKVYQVSGPSGTFDHVPRAPKLEHLQACWPVVDTFGALGTWSNVNGGTWNLVYLQDLGQSQVWSLRNGTPKNLGSPTLHNTQT